MKVYFERSALAEALQLVGSVVPSRTPKPILQCVLIDVEEEVVHLIATDMEVGINTLVEKVKVERKGRIVIHADKLHAIVRESSDEVLSLEQNGETCHITGRDSVFTIFCQDSEQFPSVPILKETPDLIFGLKELQIGTKQCIFATAKESSRYAINGVLWEIEEDVLYLVGTDGRRLARSRIELDKVPDEVVLEHRRIVPAKTMMLIERMVCHEDQKVEIKFVGNQIIISSNGIIISSNLVEGTFPRYQDIIPKDYKNCIELETAAVLSAVRRASLLASEESKGIKITLTENDILFNGRAPEAGAAEIRMPIEYNGEPVSIGFNPQFLSEALKVISNKTLEMHLGQADGPGLFQDVSGFQYVLMPINLA